MTRSEKQKVSTKTPSEVFAKLKELVENIDFAMFTTVDGDKLRSRPMSTQKLDENDKALWFFSRESLPKSQEIKTEPAVNIAYSDPKHDRYVSISGRAAVVTDREKMRELWKPILRAWYPQGLDDPGICLIRVDIEQAEYWDTPSGTMVQLFGMAKALVTGTSLDYAGENEKLDLEH